MFEEIPWDDSFNICRGSSQVYVHIDKSEPGPRGPLLHKSFVFGSYSMVQVKIVWLAVITSMAMAGCIYR